MARQDRGRAVVTERDLTNTAITPSDLDQPEVPALEQRIAAARALRAPDDEACRDCWRRGRDAAIRALLEGHNPADALPTIAERHIVHAFTRGRAAAVAALQA